MTHTKEHSSLKQSYSFSGQSEELNKASMALTYNVQSNSVAKEMSQSQLGLSIPCSNDCERRDMSNPKKGKQLEEEPSVNTTASPVLVKPSSVTQTDSSLDYSHGQLDNGELLVDKVVANSLINRFTYFQVCPLLETEDRDLFITRLILREKAVQSTNYHTWEIHLYDTITLLDIVRRYISMVLEQTFTLRIKF